MDLKLFRNQLIGVMYRRFLTYWNSKFSFLFIVIFTLSISSVVGLNKIVTQKMSTVEEVNKLDFLTFNPNNLTFGRISNKNCSKCEELQRRLSDKFASLFKKKLNVDIKFVDFDTFEDFNDFQFERVINPKLQSNIPMAFQIYGNSSISNQEEKPNGDFQVRYLYNQSSDYTADTKTLHLFERGLLDLIFDELGVQGDADITQKIIEKGQYFYNEDENALYEMFVPYFAPVSFIIIAAVFLHRTIQDIKTPVRPYMLACGLSKFTYWLGLIFVDSINMSIYSLFVYIMYVSFGMVSFKTYYMRIFFLNWFCSLLPLCYTYLWSFLVKGYVGSIIFIVANLSLLITIITTYYTVQPEIYIKLYCIITLLCPFGNWYGVFLAVSNNIIFNIKELPRNLNLFKGFNYVLIIMFISICFYPLILFIIEFFGDKIRAKFSKHSFGSHFVDFASIKSGMNITDESKQMEEQVRLNPDDYAIRIFNVSKIFHDTVGLPICAVNQVSLGIKEKSIFGFLGSNGAGKTTLMKMILKEIPISSGTIEIYGHNVETSKITNVAVCPQFDDHLTEQLTGRQNMKFFCYLFNKSGDESEKLINRIVDTMDYSEHVDKQIKAMSGGNRRKCAASIPFLSDYKTILLDEPTSSLDPIARHHMHELINNYKGERTFMLCTHLLDEAESLCDNISIMIDGCIYTVGTPQYLSNKFGTEWKIDLLLTDDSQYVSDKVKNYIFRNIPSAVLSIERKTSMIISVPSESISISEIFQILQRGKDSDIGFKFFTCSCSNLEKVFMEIVMRSELKSKPEQENDQSNEKDNNVSIDQNGNNLENIA